MITKIAKKINDKHGERVLVELDLEDRESKQRVRAMSATYTILGQEDAYLDLNDRRVAFAFAVGYTISYALIRFLG